MTLKDLIGTKELEYRLAQTSYLGGAYELKDLQLLRNLTENIGEDASCDDALTYLKQEYNREMKMYLPDVEGINRQIEMIRPYVTEESKDSRSII